MKPALFSCLALLALAACDRPSPKAQQAPPQAEETATTGYDSRHAGTPAPDLPLETGPDGKTETIADILKRNPGQPVLVNLWATWCAPCLKELPTLDRLAAATRGKLLVTPVSQDMEGWRRVSPVFTPEKYPDLRTHLESRMQFGFQVQAKGLPVSILYGPDGREIWRYSGDRDWASAESRAKLGL